MISITEFFAVIFYVLGAILLITLIMLVLRLMNTLDKVDHVIDDVSDKSRKLDGVFSLVDKTADAINTVSDTVTQFIVSGIHNLLNRKKKKEGMNDE